MATLDYIASRSRIFGMGRGNFKVGDEVAVTAIVRSRVTPDLIGVTIPSYAFPDSVVDSTSKAVFGKHMEFIGPVMRIDGDKVTIRLRPLVTVDADHVRLVESYRSPTRKRTSAIPGRCSTMKGQVTGLLGRSEVAKILQLRPRQCWEADHA